MSPPLLIAPFTALIVGPSGSGKTHLLKTLLLQEKFENCHLFFRSWQPLYCEFPSSTKFYHYDISSEIDNEGETSLETFCREISKQGTTTIIFDDALAVTKFPCIEEIFTRLSHHLNINMFLLVQNLFEPSLRIISRNANYIFLFRCPRDSAQIRHLAFQMFPEKALAHGMMKIFKHLTQQPYNAMLLDFKTETAEYARLKGGFIGEGGPLIYCIKGGALPPASSML